MASNNCLAFALAAVFLLPAAAIATEYIVGDDKGWNVNVNYTAWASGKVFHVGDTLVFQYQPPHNVYSVDANGFKNCIASGEGRTSGNDTITLQSSGKKWYICSVGKHCSELGQKLVIDVEGSATTAPAPTPDPGTACGLSSSGYLIFVATMVVAVAAMILV